MLKKIYFISLFFFYFMVFSGAETNKVVYIDMENILQVSKAGQSINKQLQNYIEKKQSEIKKIEEEIKNEDAKINAQKNILNEDELNKKIKEFNLKIKSYQNKLKKNREDIANKQIKATGKLLEELKPILADYSKQNSISLVLQKKDIIIGVNELNITKDIINLVDKKISKIEIN